MDKYLTEEFWKDTLNRGIEWFINTLPSALLIIVLMFISIWLFNKLMRRIQKGMIKATQKLNEEEDALEKEKRITTLSNIIRQVGKIIIYSVFILIFLTKLGLNIGPLLASAGIAGLAVGFGAQELVRDFISGFFMLFENQVREGDVAVINGTGGLVEEITLRTITLRDFSGVVHIFQNGKVNTLANMTKEWSAMVFDIGVAYKEDLDRVKKVIAQVGEDLQKDEIFEEKILEPLEIFGLDKFGDSALVIRARIKTKPIEQWNVGREFNGRLKKAFDKENIEIPFPHRTIYWGDAISPLKLSKDE